MARAQDLDGIFKPTTGKKAEQVPSLPAEGRTVSVGVGLKESEVEALDALAGELGVARNALLRYAVRYFLTDYQAGKIELENAVEEPEVRKRLRMP